MTDEQEKREKMHYALAVEILVKQWCKQLEQMERQVLETADHEDATRPDRAKMIAVSELLRDARQSMRRLADRITRRAERLDEDAKQPV